MLKDRIFPENSKQGFMVTPENGSDRTIFYGTYNFKDDPDYVPEPLSLGEYRESFGETNFNEFGNEKKDLLYVREMEDDRIVDECRMCVSSKKGRIGVTIGKAPLGYGRSCAMISFEWEEGDRIPINEGYFWLIDRNKEKYPFISKDGVIMSRYEKGREIPDGFIFKLNDGTSIEDYNVETAPIVKEKYEIINHR